MAAIWAGLDEAERAAIRAAVLAEQPTLRRYPRMLEAACIDRVALAGNASGNGAAGTGRMTRSPQATCRSVMRPGRIVRIGSRAGPWGSGCLAAPLPLPREL